MKKIVLLCLFVFGVLDASEGNQERSETSTPETSPSKRTRVTRRQAGGSAAADASAEGGSAAAEAPPTTPSASPAKQKVVKGTPVNALASLTPDRVKKAQTEKGRSELMNNLEKGDTNSAKKNFFACVAAGLIEEGYPQQAIKGGRVPRGEINKCSGVRDAEHGSLDSFSRPVAMSLFREEFEQSDARGELLPSPMNDLHIAKPSHEGGGHLESNRIMPSFVLQPSTGKFHSFDDNDQIKAVWPKGVTMEDVHKKVHHSFSVGNLETGVGRSTHVRGVHDAEGNPTGEFFILVRSIAETLNVTAYPIHILPFPKKNQMCTVAQRCTKEAYGTWTLEEEYQISQENLDFCSYYAQIDERSPHIRHESKDIVAVNITRQIEDALPSLPKRMMKYYVEYEEGSILSCYKKAFSLAKCSSGSSSSSSSSSSGSGGGGGGAGK